MSLVATHRKKDSRHAEPEPQVGRPKGPERDAFQIRIKPKLHRALLRAAGIGRRTKNAEVEIALEKYLEGLGLYSPDPPEDD